jgi:hypothetical protein
VLLLLLYLAACMSCSRSVRVRKRSTHMHDFAPICCLHFCRCCNNCS